MKRIFAGALLTVVGGAALVAAQTPVTYTGCLEEGSTPGTYVLTGIQSGATATKAPSGAVTEDRILLSGAPAGFNMTSSLNHKIVMSGSWANNNTTSWSSGSAIGSTHSGSPSSPPNPGTPAAAGIAPNASDTNPDTPGHPNTNNPATEPPATPPASVNPSSSASAPSSAAGHATPSLDSGLRTMTIRTARVLSDRCSM